jgi:hypothetical protein
MQAQNIDEVIEILDRIIAKFREQGSRLAFFPALYRAVTLRVRTGIADGRFADPIRMDRLDTMFANRYFRALEQWEIREGTPRAWWAAFEVHGQSGIMILQHLLLGMNAHINFDLPIAALEAAAPRPLPELKGDFMAINEILGDLLGPSQEAVNRFSPLLDLLDRVGGRSDETIVTFSLGKARDEAWHEATRLALEDPTQRDRSILSLDRRVALLGERIIVPGGPVGLMIDVISQTEDDDARLITDALLAIH